MYVLYAHIHTLCLATMHIHLYLTWPLDVSMGLPLSSVAKQILPQRERRRAWGRRRRKGGQREEKVGGAKMEKRQKKKLRGLSRKRQTW